MSDPTFRGSVTWRGETVDVPSLESMFTRAAESSGVRVVGSSILDTAGPRRWPWSRPAVRSYTIRFVARADTPEQLADFVHRVGAERAA